MEPTIFQFNFLNDPNFVSLCHCHKVAQFPARLVVDCTRIEMLGYTLYSWDAMRNHRFTVLSRLIPLEEDRLIELLKKRGK